MDQLRPILSAHDFVDSLAYLRDTAVTLSSLVACHAPAAAALLSSAPLLHSTGAENCPKETWIDVGMSSTATVDLFAALADLHDSSLPQLAAAVRQPGMASALGLTSVEEAETRVGGVRLRIEQLVCGLIQSAFLDKLSLTPSSVTRLPSSAASASQQAPSTYTAKFRVGVHALDPGRRGEEMMALLMSVPSDPPGLSGGRSSAGKGQGLLAAANARFGLDAFVSQAIDQVC